MQPLVDTEAFSDGSRRMMSAEVMSTASGALRRSLTRSRAQVWLVTQAAAGAGAAWFLATTFLSHSSPIFASIAAVVALAANVGSRGAQAVTMLVGVVAGVVVGEVLAVILGTGTTEIGALPAHRPAPLRVRWRVRVRTPTPACSAMQPGAVRSGSYSCSQ